MSVSLTQRVNLLIVLIVTLIGLTASMVHHSSNRIEMGGSMNVNSLVWDENGGFLNS